MLTEGVKTGRRKGEEGVMQELNFPIFCLYSVLIAINDLNNMISTKFDYSI